MTPSVTVIRAPSYRDRWYTLWRAGLHTSTLRRGDREVLAWLASHASHYEPSIDQGREDLGGISQSTWDKSVKRLRQAGWLTVDRERRIDGTWSGVAVYVIHHPEYASEAEEILRMRARATAIGGRVDFTTGLWGLWSSTVDVEAGAVADAAVAVGDPAVAMLAPSVTGDDWMQPEETSTNPNVPAAHSLSANIPNGDTQGKDSVSAASVADCVPPLIENSKTHTPRAGAREVSAPEKTETVTGSTAMSAAEGMVSPPVETQPRWRLSEAERDSENLNLLREIVGNAVVDSAPRAEAVTAARLVQGLIGAGWAVEVLSEPTRLGGCDDLGTVRQRARALLGKHPAKSPYPDSPVLVP